MLCPSRRRSTPEPLEAADRSDQSAASGHRVEAGCECKCIRQTSALWLEAFARLPRRLCRGSLCSTRLESPSLRCLHEVIFVHGTHVGNWRPDADVEQQQIDGTGDAVLSRRNDQIRVQRRRSAPLRLSRQSCTNTRTSASAARALLLKTPSGSERVRPTLRIARINRHRVARVELLNVDVILCGEHRPGSGDA